LLGIVIMHADTTQNLRVLQAAKLLTVDQKQSSATESMSDTTAMMSMDISPADMVRLVQLLSTVQCVLNYRRA
jgi:hypothetical protein